MNTTTNSPTHNKVVIAAASLLTLAGVAFAQDGFDRPLGEPRQERAQREPARPVERQARSFVSVSKIEGDKRYDVEIRDGELTAKINGREVPEDQLRWDGDRLEILDDNGDVLTSFNVTAPQIGIQPAPRRGFGGGGGGLRPGQPLIVPPRGLGQAAPDAPPPPPVMMGITMSDVPRALLEHMELEPDSTVMIDHVIEGLPAERAGLRPRDIIVEIDGNRPVTMKTIRETLNRKNAGDAIDLTVIRRGQETSLKVELVAFDEERLAPAARERALQQGADDAFRGAEEARRMLEELERRPGGLDLDAFLGELDADNMQRFRDLLQHRDMGGRRPGIGAWPEGFEFFVPVVPRDQRGMTDRLSQLDERMLDIERQMEHLAERLREMHQALERQQEPERD